MRKHHLKWRYAGLGLLALLTLVALSGCELFGLGKDPIEGTWDAVAYVDTGVRYAPVSTHPDESTFVSSTIDVNESDVIWTRVDSYFGIATYTGSWSSFGDSYSIQSVSPGLNGAAMWFVGDELRLWEAKNDMDYYAFEKR